MKLPATIRVHPIGLAASGTKVLDFVIETIDVVAMTHWGRFATGASVSLYYDKQTTWTQCKLASQFSEGVNCCGATPPESCNTSPAFSTVLKKSGNWGSTTLSKPTLADLTNAIDGDKPPCGAITYTVGTAVVAFYGYTSPEVLYVGDPAVGYTLINYSDFPAGYQAGGTWSGWYKTVS